MTPAAFHAAVLLPGAAGVPALMNTPESRLLLMAIAGQESAWCARIQTPGGAARGYWQCELHGAVACVLNDTATEAIVSQYCLSQDIPDDAATVWEAIAWHDRLAYLVARLALWQDPAALPAIGDPASAYAYHLRVWRPGKPRPEAWAAIYATALSACRTV